MPATVECRAQRKSSHPSLQRQDGHPGYDTLLATLGSAWAGLITDESRPAEAAGNAEFYAVLYRVNRVRLCESWETLQYFDDDDEDFDREPAFACFESGAPVGSSRLDFVLAAYHARWADGDLDLITDEAEHLDAVFVVMAAAAPGEKDLLIVGDFNLVPADIAALTSAADRTEGSGSTLNTQGERTQNLYDHVLVHDGQATGELAGNAVVLDVRGEASSPKSFYTTVSDHLPIVGTLRAGGHDDD